MKTVPNRCEFPNENATPLTWMCSRLMPVSARVCLTYFSLNDCFFLDPLYSCCERGGKFGLDLVLSLRGRSSKD